MTQTLYWEVTTHNGETRTFHDVERARELRDRHPQNSGTTIVDTEIQTPIGSTAHSYQRPGLHTKP